METSHGVTPYFSDAGTDFLDAGVNPQVVTSPNVLDFGYNPAGAVQRGAKFLKAAALSWKRSPQGGLQTQQGLGQELLQRGLGQELVQRAQVGKLAQMTNAQAAAAALRREIETRGGAHSAGMGVLRHVMRDLSGNTQGEQQGCDCTQQGQGELAQIRSVTPKCGCPKPMPPPRLIRGEDCDDILPEQGEETSGVRWMIDCPSKWKPVRRPSPPTVEPEEEQVYTVGPDAYAQSAEPMEAPPGDPHPEIEADVMGPHPDIFAPQEPWHELKNYRNEWYYDYEAAPYTAQYDETGEHDQFTPEEPWNDRPDDIVLDATFGDMKNACLAAGEDHVWNSESHECLYEGQLKFDEKPRGTGITQEGPSRIAIDGKTPPGDVIDDAKELDEFGARRPEPAGEVDQFGWRQAPPTRLRDTTLDYQTIDLERACRAQMNIPGKGIAYSWDPAQGKCLYMGQPARDAEQPPRTSHPLTDGIYADVKRECLESGGEWKYPRFDGQPGNCEKRRRR
jgi:hypothetical protein